MKVYTLGNQGLSLEAYTQTLLSVSVGIVLDVRETPWSYNRRYIRSVMERELTSVGIDYEHLKACGNPAANRKTARSVAECLSRYKRYLRKNSDCLIELRDYIRKAADLGRPACLTCYERDSHDCHRSVLLDALAAMVPSIQIEHLQAHTDPNLRRVGASPLFSGTTARL